jgi:hypothetical protein
VFIRALKGLEISLGKCLRVLKLLYKLKQSGREWYLKAAGELLKLGLKPTFADAYVFVCKDKKLIIGLYINNIIILTDNFIII